MMQNIPYSEILGGSIFKAVIHVSNDFWFELKS